jgi:hypothetical protein
MATRIEKQEVALKKTKDDADQKLLKKAYDKIKDGRDFMALQFHGTEIGAAAASSLKVIDGELAILSGWLKEGGSRQ